MFKSTVAIVVFSVFRIASAVDNVSIVQNTPNLVGYWRFDAVFKTNSLVNGYTGVLHGNAQFSAPGTGCPLATDSANQA